MAKPRQRVPISRVISGEGPRHGGSRQPLLHVRILVDVVAVVVVDEGMVVNGEIENDRRNEKQYRGRKWPLRQPGGVVPLTCGTNLLSHADARRTHSLASARLRIIWEPREETGLRKCRPIMTVDFFPADGNACAGLPQGL